MAEIILTNVLNEKISIDELFKWLTSENPEETICSEIVQNGSTRGEFVSYFLNYLREQCKRILPEIKEAQEKPSEKLIQNESQNVAAPMTEQFMTVDPQGLPRHHPNAAVRQSNEQTLWYNNDYKTRPGGQPVFQNIIQPVAAWGVYSPPVAQHQTVSINPGTGSPANMRMPFVHFPPLSYQHINNQIPMNATVQRMPTGAIYQNFNPRNSQFSQHNAFVNWNPGCVSNVQQAMSPRHQYLNNSRDERFPINSSSPYNSPNVSFDNFNSTINQTQMQMGNLNLSAKSLNFDNNYSNSSVDSPKKIHNSTINDTNIEDISNISFSPMSPLYANNVSLLCPRRNDKSNNETLNSFDISSTSENISKNSDATSKNLSVSKKSLSGLGSKICLGDYITLQGNLQTKSLRKQTKSQSSQKLTNETNSPTIEKKSKRRINPTRLDVSDDKDSGGKEVFGVISRPTVVNPKFVEAPSADKAKEEVSFEVERGLLKLERQRQPNNEITIEKINVESKNMKKSMKLSTIMPCVNLVDNIEILNILSNIYSGILDRNLMTNPMTELYFLVILLTTQYKKLIENKRTPKKNIIVKSDESSSSINLLKNLKDDLGCADLIDENSDEFYAEGSTNDDSKNGSTEDDTKKSGRDASTDKTETRTVDTREDTFEYLGTAHNCVYFASMVMLDQQFLLSTLDRTTLKLLCENQQISTFQPDLKKYFNDIYSAKCLQSNRIKQFDSRNLQTNVCFQVDTDNRETFPSLVAFSFFRKQRDLFYDILKNWEDCHLMKDWVFQNALKNKINALLTMHTDPVNYCHFAKLFISQLLVSSMQTGQIEDSMNDESLSFLKSLKQLNPEKLMQLKERLVTPFTSTGPVPQPTFPGIQEFYKEFIITACNWKFYVILEMSFIREINELNETQFIGSEIEGTETTVDEITKQNFITCVSNLRLLSKFLSFTVSLPFKSAANTSEWFRLQMQLRSRVFPSLDLRDSLVDALKHGRLSLTVPWIVQYMAMLDTITLRLPYYANIGEILYCIYRDSNRYRSINNDDTVSQKISILISFTIGWLFDLPNFPRELYDYWRMKYNEKKLKLLVKAIDERNYCRELNTIDAESSEKFIKDNANIDKLDIIDDRALYECCPFLAEFKVLLISGNAIIGNNTTNRHITPVSSQLSQPTFGVKTKNLHMQLEEAFFHGQPSSIRKTVDFVAERVASSCVKYICNSIIPSVKERNIKEFIKSKNGKLDLNLRDEEEDEDKSPFSPDKSSNKISRKAEVEMLERKMQELAKTIMDNVKRESQRNISDMCETRTLNSIDSLLADDTFPSVKETCIAITRRIATERIDQWIESHIVESLFLKNMLFELKKILKEGDVEKSANDCFHNPEAPCPTEVIGMMRNSMWELLENKGRWSELSEDSVVKILLSMEQTLMQRADLIKYPERNLYIMSVEFCLLLLTNREDLYTKKIQRTFINIWKINNNRSDESEGLFARIISPRNIRLLTHKSKASSMKIFGKLLQELIRENLLTIEALSEQCVALFRQEWPTPILKQLSQCLNDVVSDYKISNAEAEGVKYLLSWIASTCEEMEICDYD